MVDGQLSPPWDRLVRLAQKVLVWAMVFGVLWLLRPFFFLVFLTFVFGYILHHMVAWTEGYVGSRRVRVASSFLLILGLLVGVGFWIGPALAQQAKEFPAQVEANLGKLDEFVDRLRSSSPSLQKVLPDEVRAQDILAQVLGVENIGSGPERRQALTDGANPALAGAAANLRRASEGLAEASREGGEIEDEALRRATGELAETMSALGAAIEGVPEEATDGLDAWKSVLPKVIGAAQLSFSIGSAFLLALLFSFLIVYDFPTLARGARHLHDTRLQFVYDEVSDSVFYFGRVLGQALVAQLMIAIVNTSLTAVGLWWLDLPNRVLLSVIVFVCSFIPVAGVFISSVPICTTALSAGDVNTLFLAIAFITIIHVIEAYVLNPRIYSAQLRMNPVLVLAILVIAHHVAGLWGLILGVPVVNYMLRHVIEAKSAPAPEHAPSR